MENGKNMNENTTELVERPQNEKKSAFNRIFTIVQIVLIVICVVASIFIIINPGRYTKNPDDCRTGMMVVMSDSMEPTIKSNDIIFGKDVPEGILDLGTVVTFAMQNNQGYYLDTHRIVGYYCTYKDAEDKVQLARVYRVKGEMENAADLLEMYPNYTIEGYITRGDKYTLMYGATIENPTIYTEDGSRVDGNDDPGVREFDDILAVWGGKRIGGVGSVIKFLQKPIAFALVILLPLVLLFAYNIFLIVKMVIADKTKKAREAALAEVESKQIDEEEIKRKAIEEYLASLKKQEDESSKK